MFTQTELQDSLAARMRIAGPSQGRAAAIAVLRSFEPADFAVSIVGFVAALSPAVRRHWLADFTRTLYLAGNPDNLIERYPPTTVTPGGSVCWYEPAPSSQQRGLLLLLRTLHGDLLPDVPVNFSIVIPDAPGPQAPADRWRLTVDGHGLSLPQYLIHLTHTLAEAVITEILRPGDHVHIVHDQGVTAPPGGYAYLRVHKDHGNPSTLRAYTCLSKETADG